MVPDQMNPSELGLITCHGTNVHTLRTGQRADEYWFKTPNENELVEDVKSERKDVTEHDHEGQALLMHKCQNEDEGIVA